MRIQVSIGFVAITMLPAHVFAQARDTLEQFVGGAIATGRTPVLLPTGTRSGVHASGRLEAGFQRGAFGVGVGGRYWHLPRTPEFGGSGFDVFALGEIQLAQVRRTRLRVTAGTSNENIDRFYGSTGAPGAAPVGTIHAYFHRSGFMASVGVVHGIPANGLSMTLSADALAPIMGDEENGRRRPVLEFGVGLRRLSRPPAASGLRSRTH